MQISAGGALSVTPYGILIGYQRRRVPLRFSVSLVGVAPSPLRQFVSAKHNLAFYQKLTFIELAIWRNLSIMSVSSVDFEMQSSTHPPPTATGSEDEENQQCWRDVEAETGHSSYKSFLEALPETGPQYKSLLDGIPSSARVQYSGVSDRT